MGVISEIFTNAKLQTQRDWGALDKLEEFFPDQLRKIEKAQKDEAAKQLIATLAQSVLDSEKIEEDQKAQLFDWLNCVMSAYLNSQSAGWQYS